MKQISDIQRTNRDPFVLVPAVRRIGGSYTFFIYAGGTQMAIAETFAALKATWDTPSAALTTKQAIDINAVKLAMGNQLFELQGACFALQEQKAAVEAEKREIEAELVELRKKADERSQYELFEPYTGVTVLRRKPVDGGSEVGQYACPRCMTNRGIASILQFRTPAPHHGECDECRVRYRFTEASPVKRRPSGGPHSWMSW